MVPPMRGLGILMSPPAASACQVCWVVTADAERVELGSALAAERSRERDTRGRACSALRVLLREGLINVTDLHWVKPTIGRH
jgi:hypothetical protein